MTYITWRNKRPYVYKGDGSYLGRYVSFRHRRPCGAWKDIYNTTEKWLKLKKYQIAYLTMIDKEAERGCKKRKK